MGFAIFLTLLPLSFRFRIRWTFLQESPPEATALVCLGALACWVGFCICGDRLQRTGL